MRYRVMRLMIFFDLPTLTSTNRRNYRKFRKSLIDEGFLMIQESVYVRVTTNRNSAELLEKRIKGITPADGLVQSLIITEKQYIMMNFLAGEPIQDVRNTDDKLVVI